MGFLTPQGGNADCCCNGDGSGERCDCSAGGDMCSIHWGCNASLPTIPPHRIRITRGTDIDDEDHDLILESSELSGHWPVPDNTNAFFRVEMCCQDPGNNECVWQTLWEGQIDSVTTPCDIVVAGGIRYLDADDNPAGFWPVCGGKVRVFGAAGQIGGLGACPPGITSLSIEGQVVGGGSPIVGCIPPNINGSCQSGSGINLSCPPFPFHHDLRYIDIPIPLDEPDKKIVISATNGCGRTRTCEIGPMPCDLHYNYRRVEVPSWNGYSYSCSGSEPQPPGWFPPSNFDHYWTQNWESSIEITGGFGGSHFAPTFIFCDQENLGTGSFEWNWLAEGLHSKYVYPPDGGAPYWVALPYKYQLRYWANIRYALAYGTLFGQTFGSVRAFFTEPLNYESETLDPRWSPLTWIRSGTEPSARFTFPIMEIVNAGPTLSCSASPPRLLQSLTWRKRDPWRFAVQYTPVIGRPPAPLLPQPYGINGWSGPTVPNFFCLPPQVETFENLYAELLHL